MSSVYWFVLAMIVYLSIPFAINLLERRREGSLWKKHRLDLFITEIDYLFWLPITLGCLLWLTAGFTLLLGQNLSQRIWLKILSIS